MNFFLRFPYAKTKTIKRYQSTSTVPAVKINIIFSNKVIFAFINGLKTAKKKAAILGFRNAIKKPVKKDPVCDVKVYSLAFELLISVEKPNKNNKIIPAKLINIFSSGNVERAIPRPDTTRAA